MTDLVAATNETSSSTIQLRALQEKPFPRTGAKWDSCGCSWSLLPSYNPRTESLPCTFIHQNVTMQQSLEQPPLPINHSAVVKKPSAVLRLRLGPTLIFSSYFPPCVDAPFWSSNPIQSCSSLMRFPSWEISQYPAASSQSYSPLTEEDLPGSPSIR